MANKLFSAFVVCLFFSGCETFNVLNSVLEPPKVTVSSVDVSDIGLKGINLSVNLSIDNPNSTPLNLDQFKYALSIGDASVFNGTYDKKIEIKPKDVSRVTIPVNVDYNSAKAAIENYIFKSIREYKFKGSLTSGVFTVPIDDSGKIEIK